MELPVFVIPDVRGNRGKKPRAATGRLETAVFRNRFLLDRAAYLRKHVVGIRPDEANRSDHDYQNHREHHRIFRDILTALIVPELL